MAPQPKAVPQIIQELWELLKAYARQETVDPLKGLARYLAYGVGGSLTIALGGLFLSLSLLRLLQHFSVFADTWSFVPYVVVMVALLVAIGGIAAVLAPPRGQKAGGGEPEPTPSSSVAPGATSVPATGSPVPSAETTEPTPPGGPQ